MYHTYMKQSSEKRPAKHFTFSLLEVANSVSEKLEGGLAELGLSMAKQSALTALADAGEPLTLSDLAARLSCVRSNITQLVDRLEADGLVRRVDDPADRRSVRAELTPSGAEKQAAGKAAIARVQHDIAKQISAADLIGLESALGALG